jgi:hypothetical protein
MVYVSVAPDEPRLVRIETSGDLETMTTSSSRDVTVIWLSAMSGVCKPWSGCKSVREGSDIPEWCRRLEWHSRLLTERHSAI